MIGYCEAEKNLKVKVLAVALQSLFESNQAGDRTLGDILNRFVQNSINYIKQDQDTQEEVLSYLLDEPQNCSNPYF